MAQLLNRDGTNMSDVVVKPVDAGRRRQFETDLPLGSLPAGEFMLQVTLAGDGKRSRTDWPPRDELSERGKEQV